MCTVRHCFLWHEHSVPLIDGVLAGYCGEKFLNFTLEISVFLQLFVIYTSTRETMYVYRNIEARSNNHFCRGNAISITYYECMSVALVIRHAKRMRRIILPSVVCLAVPYFSTLSHKRHDFRKRSYRTRNVCFYFLYKLCLNISHSKKNSARYYHKCT
jgi:hypothetical protein